MVAMEDETTREKAMWLYPKLMGFDLTERWGHSACYFQGNIYVFGGCCGGLHFSDVLVLNLETMVWSTLVPTGDGPGARDSHSAVVLGCMMIVFGGTSGSNKCNDLHILNLLTKEWTRPECAGNPPPPRESQSVTLIENEKLVVFGGSGEGAVKWLNDLHVLDLRTMIWTSPEVKGDIPVPRDSHSAVSIGRKLLVYGGDRGDSYYGDVDMLDMDTMTWSRLAVQGCSPGGRAGHAAVSIGTKVYVIGGVGHKRYYNDVWVLDLTTCSWSQLDVCGQLPQGRFSHTAVVADVDIAVFGGCGEDDRPLNELLVLQLGAEQLNESCNFSTCKLFGRHLNQERRRFSLGADFKTNVKPILMGSPLLVREPESETKPTPSKSDNLYPKRRRTVTAKPWGVESEQEEHSLSLSQHSNHSSSSHSDQEQQQTPTPKVADSPTGFHIFKSLSESPSIEILEVPAKDFRSSIQRSPEDFRNLIQRSPEDFRTPIERSPEDFRTLIQRSPEEFKTPIQRSPEELSSLLGEHQIRARRVRLHGSIARPGLQLPAVEPKFIERRPIPNTIGAEVHGRVDGVFDSGFIMSATVNGKFYRGVLFTPGPVVLRRGQMLPQPLNLGPGIIGRGSVVPQSTSSLTSQIGNVVAQPFPISNHADPSSSRLPMHPMKNSMPGYSLGLGDPQVAQPFSGVRASSLAREPNHRSDFQGLVLTLGGSGSGSGGS